ncbi:MAG: hypothetical protein Q4D51_12945 [Eubacteriales bacterium]|nr:hypothetical protein [Eubacteriales bacterium]
MNQKRKLENKDKAYVRIYIGLFAAIILLIVTGGFSQSQMLYEKRLPVGSTGGQFLLVCIILIMGVFLLSLHSYQVYHIVRNKSQQVSHKVSLLLISILLSGFYFGFFFVVQSDLRYVYPAMRKFVNVFLGINEGIEISYGILPVIYAIILLLDQGRKTKLRYMCIPVFLIDVIGIVVNVGQVVRFIFFVLGRHMHIVGDTFFITVYVFIYNVALVWILLLIAINITCKKTNQIKAKWMMLTCIAIASLFVYGFAERKTGGIAGICQYRKISVMDKIKESRNTLENCERNLATSVWNVMYPEYGNRECK